jgi:hypothetical protein
VIEGELTVWVGGELFRAPQGSLVYAPPGVPHTFAITSDEARFLGMIQPTGFEQFLEEASVPATELTLPPDGAAPDDPARLAALAAEYDIEILGPPGLPGRSPVLDLPVHVYRETPDMNEGRCMLLLQAG